MATSSTRFSFSDGNVSFRTPRAGCGRFVLRSRASGYEHEFDWDDLTGELVSVATLRHLGEFGSFSAAVRAAKVFMLNERTLQVDRTF